MPLPEQDSSALSDELRRWCDAAVAAYLQDAWTITDARHIPSRTGSVYRLSALHHSLGRRDLFLKVYEADLSVEAITLLISRIVAVSAALQRETGITPYVVVAHDIERRALLARALDGPTMLDVHRALGNRGGRHPDQAIAAWARVGAWLAILHRRTLAPVTAAGHARTVRDYTHERLKAWAEIDRRRRSAIHAAIDAVDAAAAAAPDPMVLVPCHGDVSGFNIFVGPTVGLIDFDDLRFDLPALDLSQALMELRHLSRAFRVVPLRAVAASAERALMNGYGQAWPDGPAFWLPHYRNLAVLGLTVARRLHGIGVSRVTDELHHHLITTELRRLNAEVTAP